MATEVLTNLRLKATPSDPEDVVNIAWVEGYFLGKIKLPVRVVATTPQAGSYTAATKVFEYTASGPLTIDGVALAQGDRVLLARQSDDTQNGVYTVTDVGNGGPAELTRATDFDASDKIFTGITITVNEGVTHSGSFWKLTTTGTITLDTSGLQFRQIEAPKSTASFSYDIEPPAIDGIETDFEVEHELGTTDVSVTIRNLTTQEMVITDWKVVDANNVEIGFADPPEISDGPYRVTVIG